MSEFARGFLIGLIFFCPGIQVCFLNCDQYDGTLGEKSVKTILKLIPRKEPPYWVGISEQWNSFLGGSYGRIWKKSFCVIFVIFRSFNFWSWQKLQQKKTIFKIPVPLQIYSFQGGFLGPLLVSENFDRNLESKIKYKGEKVTENQGETLFNCPLW